jgi:hypothetical protein
MARLRTASPIRVFGADLADLAKLHERGWCYSAGRRHCPKTTITAATATAPPPPPWSDPSAEAMSSQIHSAERHCHCHCHCLPSSYLSQILSGSKAMNVLFPGLVHIQLSNIKQINSVVVPFS